MPLIKSKSKKALQKNIEMEMDSNPAPEDKAQNLAIAYAVKRKAAKKKMANGGMVNESAASENRPMPEEADKDSKMVSRNSGNKPAKNDSWTSSVTVEQAQRPSKTRLSQPKMAPITGPFSVRNRDMHEDEANMMDRMPADNYGNQPDKRDDEMDAKKMGSDPDMAKEHSNGRKPYAKGGMINKAVSMSSAEEDRVEHPAGLEEDNDQMAPSESEIMADHFAEGGEVDNEDEIEHAASIAAAIMAKRRKMMMAEGGEILSHGSMDSDDSDQADLSRNADEDANEEDQASFSALRKENYSESAGLDLLDSPRDSAQHGDMREDNEENIYDSDIVSAIRRKMKMKSAITR